jgi:hypothetical protein
MFQFPSFASYTYEFSARYLGITPDGFPHSEISGSMPVSGLPKLIAAFHVLHRLPIPRHPPSALSSLTIKPDSLNSATVSFLPYYSIIKDLTTLISVSSSKLKAQSSKFLPFSFQLSTFSYFLVEVNGIEPMTSCVQGRRSPS